MIKPSPCGVSVRAGGGSGCVRGFSGLCQARTPCPSSGAAEEGAKGARLPSKG